MRFKIFLKYLSIFLLIAAPFLLTSATHAQDGYLQCTPEQVRTCINSRGNTFQDEVGTVLTRFESTFSCPENYENYAEAIRQANTNPSTIDIYKAIFRSENDTKCSLFDTLPGWFETNCGCSTNQAAGGAVDDQGRVDYENIVTYRVIDLINAQRITVNGAVLPAVSSAIPTPTMRADPTPTLDPARASEFAAMIANNCGYTGMSCCEIDATSFEGKTPPLSGWFDGKGILGKLTGWFTGVVTEGIVSSQKEIAATADDQTLCKGNRYPSLSRIGKSPIDGLNRFDQENKTYFVQEDCSIYLSVTEPESYNECIANPAARPLPKAEVESCDCVDPEAESIDPRKVGMLYEYDHDPIMIQGQICKGSQPCEDCLEAGHYWQSWLSAQPQDMRCVTALKDVENNLNKRIDALTQSSSALRSSASFVNEKNSNVLQATALCGPISDDIQRKACEQCTGNMWYWNKAGCTETTISSLHSRRLCSNISDDEEKSKCNQCIYSGSYWTAIGCIEPDIPAFIEKQIFGWGLGIAGAVALGCIMFAGFSLQTSSGDPERVKKAQELMTSCITGLIIIIFSILIIRIIGVDLLRIPGLTTSSTSTTPTAVPPSRTTPTPQVPTATLTPQPTINAGAILSGIPTSTPTPTSTPFPTIDPSAILSGAPTATIPPNTPTPVPIAALSALDCDASRNPGSTEIYLFDRANFGGPCLRLSVGTYNDFNNLQNKQVDFTNLWSFGQCDNRNYDDCIASIKVGSDVQIELYSSKNNAGTAFRYVESNPELGNGILDKTSSAKVCTNTNKEGGVLICRP